MATLGLSVALNFANCRCKSQLSSISAFDDCYLYCFNDTVIIARWAAKFRLNSRDPILRNFGKSKSNLAWPCYGAESWRTIKHDIRMTNLS